MENPPPSSHPVLRSTPGRWRSWKIALCLVVIFVGGIAVGAVSTLQVLRYGIARRADPASWTPLMLDRIDHDVHLTAEQRRTLEPLVRAGIADTLQVRDRAFAEIAGIIERSRLQAAATLSADQQQRLDAFIAGRAKMLHRLVGNAAPTATPAGTPPINSPNPR